MYVTDTTVNVKELFEDLLKKNDITKLKFIIYVANALYNKQINNKNIANPDLVEDNDLIIFELTSIGIENHYVAVLLGYLLSIYVIKDNKHIPLLDNGNITGLNLNKNEEKLISNFEKLDFYEKLDVISELIIRYDNLTYFKEQLTIMSLSDNITGFDIAKLIQDYKNNK